MVVKFRLRVFLLARRRRRMRPVAKRRAFFKWVAYLNPCKKRKEAEREVEVSLNGNGKMVERAKSEKTGKTGVKQSEICRRTKKLVI